jgi:hypothetical protein
MITQTLGGFSQEDAARMLALLATSHEPVALRGLWSPGRAEEVHFRDHAAALDWLARHDGKRALYAVLNPLKPDAIPNVTDTQIAALRWFPLDADPKRPADTASTDTELQAAQDTMTELLEFLATHIPDLSASVVQALSGNGAHALLRLPDYNPAEAHRLKCLGNALCAKFSDTQVGVDRTVFNPSRIWRVYGTLNLKGTNTADRPHRRAQLLSQPGFQPVPIDLLAYENVLLAALDATPTVLSPKPSPNRGGKASLSEQEGVPTPSDFCLPLWWGKAVPAGERNDAAYRRTRWLSNPTEGNQTAEAAWPLLQAWNLTCCRPALDLAELQKTFDSAGKRGPNPEFHFAAAPAPALPKWPETAPEMFHGLAGDVVRLIAPHTEADPVALLVQLLAAFGSALGRTAYFTAEADQHYANLFVVLVGISSKGRKGTSWGHIRRLMQLAEPHWEMHCLQSGLSSGEGLIWHVRDAAEKLVKNKTTGEMEPEVVDPGIADKRLLVQESEYASVLRVAGRDGNTLSAILRDAWDKGRLQTMTKNSAAKATGAHVSVIGHVTADELRRELSSTEAGNGFANRFLWLCTKRSQELPEGGCLGETELSPLAARLSAAIDTGRQRNELRRDSDARAVWYAVYHKLSEGGPGLAGAVTSRAEAQTMRLALLYALLDGADCIRRDHLTAAIALWDYVQDSALYVFGDSLGDPVADDILRALKAAPNGLTRTDLRELFQRHQSSGRIEQALALLLRHNRACMEMQTDTGGRPAERWFAVKACEKAQENAAP